MGFEQPDHVQDRSGFESESVPLRDGQPEPAGRQTGPKCHSPSTLSETCIRKGVELPGTNASKGAQTMSETTQARVPLAADDLERVRRLTEEVKSRLYEVSLIVGRTLGRDFPGGSLVKYEPKQGSDSEEADQTIEVVVIALPDGTFACTQDPPGVSIYPC